MRSRICSLLVSVSGILALGAVSAQACAFHNYVPKITLIDQLIESAEIVAARPSKQDPMRYAALSTEALGSTDLSALRPMTDATLDRFEADPSAYALFSRTSYGPWLRMAHVDGALLPVVEEILRRLPDWKAGNEENRVGYFAGLLGHADIRIHRLALRELDRVDYDVLRSLDLSDRASVVAERMEVLSDPTLQPIQILLLGQSDDSGFSAFLWDGLVTYAHTDDPRLGAYAIAFLEHGGPSAVAALSSNLLSDTTLPASSQEAIVAALAVHSRTGDVKLAAAIETGIASAIRVNPSVAALVAHQFGSHQDWSQVQRASPTELVHRYV